MKWNGATSGLRSDRGLVEEVDMLADVIEAVFDGEVPCTQAVHLGLRQHLQISLASGGRKEDIPLAPEDDGLRLVLFQKRLPLCVVTHVGAVVIKQVQLNLLAVRTL